MTRRNTKTELTESEKAARELDRKRRDWARVTEAMDTSRALAIAKKILEAAKVRGERIFDLSAYNNSLSLRVERGWTLGADLDVALTEDFNARVVNPDNESEWAYPMGVRVTVNWSATSRTLAAATAAVALYRELIDLGAEIESVLSESPIYLVMGTKAKTEAEETAE